MRELPYGTWPSPIGADQVATSQAALSAPLLTPSGAWWCEGRPWEGGRVALVHRRRGGTVRDVTPADFNLRTRVHEYGGRAYTVAGDLIVAAAFRSQRLHRLMPDGPATPLTPASEARLRYADLLLDPARQRVIAVREDHRGSGEPENALVAVPLGEMHEGIVLHRGHDFCAAPALSHDGRRLAWLTWDHPAMPWDRTSLWVAELDARGVPSAPRRIAGDREQSALQPLWLPDGSLVFASDCDGWWNLWRWDGGEPACILPMEAECAGPLWGIGTRWFDLLDEHTLAVCVSRSGCVSLELLDLRTRRLAAIDLPLVEIGEPTCANGEILVAGAGAKLPTAIVLVRPTDGSHEILSGAGETRVAPSWISEAQAIRFPTAGGREAYAFYYRPTNPEARAPAGERPPLIVRSHGGPTARTSAGFSIALQFWTSRGFAVVDVNYGGSTGFGRDYRRRLDGQWGIVDVEDCLAAARWLVDQGEVDPQRLAIRGGSASGFTTLCALTFHDLFKAGASYYGIGDLEALARDTHKFEARYLDRLIGPYPERADLYQARSPIHHVDRLSCPLIVFQGQEDLAVPPNQAEAMVAALRAKRLPVAYLSFPGEGHGFRQAATIKTALEAEHAFFCRVFKIEPPDGTAPLEIQNL